MHVVSGAHRTASPITFNYGNTSDCCCGVRLLIPFSSYHLNTNFGNTKFFIVSWSLSLYAISWPALTSEGGIDQADVSVIRFPSGASSFSALVDSPCAVIRGVPRIPWPSDAVYMIMHHRIPWPLLFRSFT